MLKATEQCLRGLLVVGFVAAIASRAWAGDECCAKKKEAAAAAAGHSACAGAAAAAPGHSACAETAAAAGGHSACAGAAAAATGHSACGGAAKPVTRTFTLKGLTDANGGSVKQALAEFASAVELNPAAGTADVTWKAGQAFQVSKIQKALEGAGASIDEDRWTFGGPVRLQVAGMTCGGCSSAIKAALGKIEGMGEVTVDFRSSEEGLVSFAGAGTSYGTVRKALAGTPYKLVDASFCGNCSGGEGACCGLCLGKSTGVTASGAPSANTTGGCGGGCGGGAGCSCPGCTAKAKALTKTE